LPPRLPGRITKENTAGLRENNEDKSKNPFEDDRGGHSWNGFAG